ncbi:MAG: two-component system response regulator [Geobacteraceae bacterium GWC2_53_11]|nr:MAG: two-component system response regulator [Geobacteraceae bacterium GWC2_53_11]
MRKKRILVVEDEESLLKLETILLTVKGFEVIGAVSGSMAIEKIDSEVFDLVLLDIMLPDIDGFEVCRQLRKDPRTATVPIIMLTGKKTQDDHDRGVLCGANSYLVKPFKSAMIIDEINRLLTASGGGK